MAMNALAAFGSTSAKWDLVGPTVLDDIRRAVQRYGAEAVRDAVKEATKAKRGRRREPDWKELREEIEADAREWLAGRDPFAARSNYAIAKAFAERNPGQSMVSTHKRIERKLAKEHHGRRWFTLMAAETMSSEGYPYAVHLKALEAVASLPGERLGEFWQSVFERACVTVSDYEARENQPPPEHMSFHEVEQAVHKATLAALAPKPLPALPKSRGLFGATLKAENSLGKILSDAVGQAKD